jgi:hypothetical protein
MAGGRERPDSEDQFLGAGRSCQGPGSQVQARGVLRITQLVTLFRIVIPSEARDVYFGLAVNWKFLAPKSSARNDSS